MFIIIRCSAREDDSGKSVALEIFDDYRARKLKARPRVKLLEGNDRNCTYVH